MDDQFQLSAYDYFLPEDQIAQQPAAERDQSRLLVLDCPADRTLHKKFNEVTELFRPGDLLVVNNSKVFPARLLGRKETGGRVEMLLLHFPESDRKIDDIRQATALSLIKSSKRPKPGSILIFSPSLQARVDTLLPDGKVEVSLFYPAAADLEKLLETHGQIPLPPYISRPKGSTAEDSRRYQTKYARQTGSVAAPTAGLHFSSQLMSRIKEMGIRQAAVTLHVGYGTFAPVRCEDIRQHRIHREYVSVPEETALAINRTRACGGRIWAVGTTTARTIEFAADSMGRVQPIEKSCGLYIYPGYRFKVVDNLITNFHLPQSSLLFLVSALAGRKRILAGYREAVQRGYRFFSYGDAMAIINKKQEKRA
jgi:S-adenosylmethionine:tRNA ribosyltransferase-isomerase